MACLQPASAFAGPIQWVIVGDPGNTADTAPSGYGAAADGSLHSLAYAAGWDGEPFAGLDEGVVPCCSRPHFQAQLAEGKFAPVPIFQAGNRSVAR